MEKYKVYALDPSGRLVKLYHMNKDDCTLQMAKELLTNNGKFHEIIITTHIGFMQLDVFRYKTVYPASTSMYRPYEY